jgi:hypothetical protein
MKQGRLSASKSVLIEEGQALSAVAAIGHGITTDHPERRGSWILAPQLLPRFRNQLLPEFLILLRIRMFRT